MSLKQALNTAEKNPSIQKEVKETVEVANIYRDAILRSFYSLCTQFTAPFLPMQTAVVL